MKFSKAITETIYLLMVSLLLSFFYYSYTLNLDEDYNMINKGIEQKTTLKLLSKDLKEGDIETLFLESDVFNDDVYASFAAKELSHRLGELRTKGKLPANLGALNKKAFKIDAEIILKKGGELGKLRYELSSTLLGTDASILNDISGIRKLKNTISISNNPNNTFKFAGSIVNSDQDDTFSVEDIVVRLREEIPSSIKEHKLDSLYRNSTIDELHLLNFDSLFLEKEYFAKTDHLGTFEFKGLEKGRNYSVVPIHKGFEYGKLKGASQISESKTKFVFKQKRHKMPILSKSAFKTIKKGKFFILRTPSQYKSIVQTGFIFLLAGFWIFLIVSLLVKVKIEPLFLSTLMFIVGTGLLVLFSIQDPFIDIVYASSAIKAVFVVLMIGLSLTLLTRFFPQWVNNVLTFGSFTNGGRSKYTQKKYYEVLYKNGLIWLILAFLIVLSLLVLGKGPEGSGVKVNLFGIQISEIAKLLAIFFLAKFFSFNFDHFSRIKSSTVLIKPFIFKVLVLAVLIALYIFTGDLGPALVISLSFIFFYAISRQEFKEMMGIGVLYIFGLFVISWVFGSRSYFPFLFSIVSILSIAFYVFKRKKGESSFFLIVLCSAFNLAEKIPGISATKRLNERNNMFRNIWDNDLFGGDQIAQGVWSLNSGGIFGQGIGLGFSNVMPAYHTDMIFQSIGEELGMITLFLLLAAFFLLFRKSMIISFNMGDKFSFFLINGIVIATFVQLSIILSGSLGLMPLTGISVPLLSHGKVGLSVILLSFLVIFALNQKTSHYSVQKPLNKDLLKIQDFSLRFMALVTLVFATTLIYHFINLEDTITKPVKVLSKQGEWVYSYNPRIHIINKELPPADLYDRNGVLLATSEKDTFLLKSNQAYENGASLKEINKQKAGFRKRYYPFGDDLLFWLGDRNTGLVQSKRVGYVAEYRLENKLRGVQSNSPEIEIVQSFHFKEAPFLPEESKETTLSKIDYTAYIPFLKDGLNGSLYRDYIENKQTIKPVYLTLDAQLNQAIGRVINTSEFSIGKRTSVIALNAETGEVLASAQHPKPNREDIQKISQFPRKYYQKLMVKHYGYNSLVSDRDYNFFVQTSPGSIVKPINSLAYLKKYGVKDIPVFKYDANQKIRVTKKESEPSGKVGMTKAIIKSSNLYFVSLLNDYEFDNELFDLYRKTGVSIKNKGSFSFYSNYKEPNDLNHLMAEDNVSRSWLDALAIGKGLNYNKPKGHYAKSITNKNRKSRPRSKRFRQADYSYMAWGQGPILTSPFNMAKLYGIIANEGIFVEPSFVLNDEKIVSHEVLIETNKKSIIDVLNNALNKQSSTAIINSNKSFLTHYGKSGSASRKEGVLHSDSVTSKTDGWYICFVNSKKYNAPLVFAVRVEGNGGSSKTVKLWKEIYKEIERICLK